MRKLSIGIIDLVAKSRTKTFWERVMYPNFASIMPQVIATWCEEEGHQVTFVCYTGREDFIDELPDKVDIVFISAFTEAAQLAYALSNLFHSRGVVTALGGPHARCYPQDARKYFDYVLGFTDRELISEVLLDCSRYRDNGVYLSAGQHPRSLPGVSERWKFIEQIIRKAPFIKVVPVIGSLGCPYSCGFCIDSSVPYQPLDFEVMKEDLRFLLRKFDRPRIAWYDPNFGVRFNDYMEAIEEAVPPGSVDFIAEASLSLLSESHVKRLRKNGFKVLLPGIESSPPLGNKSKTGKTTGMDKVRQISEHINMILRYVPYVQTNLIFGLDIDEGPEPFELTKRFLDLCPGVFPAYSLISVYGQAAPLNLEYQRADRVLPIPFHYLNNNLAMNVKPLNYSWLEFYDHLIDLMKYSFSPGVTVRRFNATGGTLLRWLNVVRAISERFGRTRYYMGVRRQLDTDRQFRRFFEQESTDIPQFFAQGIRQDLGPFWEWLPESALYHDPNTYLLSQEEQSLSCENKLTCSA